MYEFFKFIQVTRIKYMEKIEKNGRIPGVTDPSTTPTQAHLNFVVQHPFNHPNDDHD